MTSDTALWILGAGLVPIIAYAIYLERMVACVRKQTDRLIHMHEHADKFGFGTTQTDAVQRELVIAIRSLTHYIRWMCEHTTGEKPPPPIEGIRT